MTSPCDGSVRWFRFAVVLYSPNFLRNLCVRAITRPVDP